jgi:hypothetical protein
MRGCSSRREHLGADQLRQTEKVQL